MPVYCVDCETEMKAIKSDLRMMEGKVVVKNLPAHKCLKCGKITFNIDDVIKAKTKLKQALEERIHLSVKFDRILSHDGKSLTMRIPKQIEESLKLKKGNKVTLYIESEKRLVMDV